MVNNSIVNKLTRSINKFGFQIKKHSPEILVVTGVIGTVTSAVMACKATTKLDEVLSDAKEQVNNIHAAVERSDELPENVIAQLDAEGYNEEDGKKDLTIVYAQTGLKLLKMYAPSIILGALSITAIFTSSNILRKRNMALAAAYAAIDKGFKDYRGRVIERFGEDLDKELKYNLKTKEIEETVTNEDGTETTVKKTVTYSDLNEPSAFARFFDNTCNGWDEDSTYRLFFLKKQQAYANDKLQACGILFLNEVYDMLGIPRSKMGQVVGWVYDEKNPVGDNYVDFGVFDSKDPDKIAFVNGYEPTVLLDFNVDGIVYDLLK